MLASGPFRVPTFDDEEHLCPMCQCDPIFSVLHEHQNQVLCRTEVAEAKNLCGHTHYAVPEE